MATYNKKLKTLEIHLMLDGEPITIADTADDDEATRALNEFKKYGTMHYEVTGSPFPATNAIPYHAVQYIKVTETDASVTKADPYGCEEGGSETYTVTFDKCDVPPIPYLDPITVNAGESITLPGRTLTNWFDGGCDEQGNRVGGGGDSYTPTSNVTL